VWSGRLDREVDNLRAGLNWAIEHDPRAALVLATRLSRWWRTVGRLAEGRRWLEATLAANVSEPPPYVAPALVELGVILHDQGDVVAALTTHRQALAAAESSDEEDLTTRAAIGMAWALRDSGEYTAAKGFAQQALCLARDRSDHAGEARALAVLAFIALLTGDFNGAHRLGAQAVRALSDGDTGDGAWDAVAAATVGSSFAGALDVAEGHGARLLALAERRGDRFDLAWAHMMLGTIAGMRGDAARAIDYCRRSLSLAVEIGSTRALVNALMGLVHAAGLIGSYDLGARLAGAATAVLRGAGFALPRGFDRYLRLDSYARSFGINPEPLEPAYEHGKTLTTSDAVELAYTVIVPGDDPPGGTSAVDRVSPRERELIGLVAAGLTDAQIAERLSISVRTVRSHLDRIRNKTGARRRADLTRLAVTSGLIRQ
jgi:DNA-binding CsgD family transcriptional regulator/tetratricopeptide (TPR) repeat protein